jgi:hypothetical protein
VGDDVIIDNETFLMIDFVNLKIKPTYSFEGAHRGMMCVHMFIKVSAHTCMSIYIYTVFLKKNSANCYQSSIKHICTNIRPSKSLLSSSPQRKEKQITGRSRVRLAQLIRFLVVELIHPVLNHRFDMSVVFTINYSFSEM